MSSGEGSDPGDDDPDDDTYYDMLAEQRATFRHQMPDRMLAILGGGVVEDFTSYVTLLVGGTFVSGRMVRFSEWLTAMSDVASRWPGWDATAQEFYDWSLEEHARAAVDPLGSDDVKYVHLVDLSVLSGSGATLRVGGPFRCRLSAVDGWYLGTSMHPEAS